MRNTSHKTKLAILMEHVDQWRARAGSREAVAVAIVETHQRLGLESVTGIRFEVKGDSFTLAKNAADRIFRWLDDRSKESNFMPANFEQSILAAMPSDIRLSCVGEMLRPLGLVPRAYMHCYGDDIDLISRAQAMSKEGGEAISAVIGLTKDSSLSAMESTHRELSESIGEQRAMQAALEQRMAEARREMA